MKETCSRLKYTWAIRDIEHGKTYHFESLEEMIAWVLKFNEVKE